MRLRGLLVVIALVALPAVAQIRGIPPSVTSLGGSHSPGIPASVSSINNTPIGCCVRTAFPDTVFRLGTNFGHHPRFRFDARFGGPFFQPGFQPLFIEVPVAVPVQVPVLMVPVADPNAEAEDTPRRVTRRHVDYDDDQPQRREPVITEMPQSAPAPAKPLPATVLVFRDGHQVEVHDYAISGDSFYDLSNGLIKKIPLTQLDLGATVKINEERGVPFTLPSVATARQPEPPMPSH
jgi:hypothetical protein